MKFPLFKKFILEKILAEKEKEYYCHVQFVRKVGLELAKKYKVDKEVIEVACLLHDIGRDNELEGEDHGDAGARISSELLKKGDFTAEETYIILSCIKKHNKENKSVLTLEEKVVITADCASKVLYHEAFMLMCKKPTYVEKLAWGQKYLEKGYRNIKFPDYKLKIAPKYKALKDIYRSVTAQ